MELPKTGRGDDYPLFKGGSSSWGEGPSAIMAGSPTGSYPAGSQLRLRAAPSRNCTSYVVDERDLVKALGTLKDVTVELVDDAALALLKASSIPERAKWITVRPNGPGTEGQPILIQPNPDGRHAPGPAAGRRASAPARSCRARSPSSG